MGWWPGPGAWPGPAIANELHSIFSVAWERCMSDPYRCPVSSPNLDQWSNRETEQAVGRKNGPCAGPS